MNTHENLCNKNIFSKQDIKITFGESYKRAREALYDEMLADQRYEHPGFNQNAGQAFSRGGPTRGGDDDFARASVRDGGDRVSHKPFNATVTGGDGRQS
jgi:hypothetical protein